MGKNALKTEMGKVLPPPLLKSTIYVLLCFMAIITGPKHRPLSDTKQIWQKGNSEPHKRKEAIFLSPDEWCRVHLSNSWKYRPLSALICISFLFKTSTFLSFRGSENSFFKKSEK